MSSIEFVIDKKVGLSGDPRLDYIVAVKGDTASRFVRVSMFEDDKTYVVPNTVAAILIAKKPDGTKVFNACTVTDDGKVLVPLTSGLLSVVGNVSCQVCLIGADGQRLTTVPFLVKVIESESDDAAVESTDEYTELTVKIAEVQEIINNYADETQANTAARHAHDNKQELDAIDSEILQDIESNTADRHNHSNSDALDDVTLGLLEDVHLNTSARHEHTNAVALGLVTEVMVQEVIDNTANRHNHSNAAALDDVTPELITDVPLNTAARHTHDNMVPLGKLNENESGEPTYAGKRIGGNITVQTCAELPVTADEGAQAVVLHDSTAPFEPAEFETDEEYYLFLNAYPIVDKDFSAEFTVPDEGFDDDNVVFTADSESQTVKAAYEITEGEETTKTAFEYSTGKWHKITSVVGVVTENIIISYREVPTFEGVFTSGQDLTKVGYYLAEEPFGVCKSGAYYFNGTEWVPNDSDKSIHCDSNGFASSVGGGYGNSAPGQLAFVGGGAGNSAPGQLAFVGGGSGNSAPGQLAFVGGGSGLIASTPGSAIFGRNGETPPDSLLHVANGAEPGRNTFAFNVDDDRADFHVPTVSPQHIEYYSQEVEQLRTDIVNTYIPFDDITFVLPPIPQLGIAGKFELWIYTNGAHPVSFNDFVAWENGTPYDFMRSGTHKITGFFNPLYGNKWVLDGKMYSFPAT